MKKEELLERIQNIGTCEDETEKRTMLAELSQDAEKDYDDFAEMQNTIKKLNEDNENLRAANMKLFKMVGVKEEPEDIGSPKPKEKLKFENLFNEKGGIK